MSCTMVTKSHGGTVSVQNGLTVKAAKAICDDLLPRIDRCRYLQPGSITEAWIVSGDEIDHRSISLRGKCPHSHPFTRFFRYPNGGGMLVAEDCTECPDPNLGEGSDRDVSRSIAWKY